MAKITRSIQKIFSGSIPPAENVAVFGSLQAGAIEYSDDPVLVQSLPAWGQGWSGAVVGEESPALQDMNATMYAISYNLAYVLQQGVAEWSAAQTYYTNSFCSSGGVIYKSVVDNNLNNAVTNSLYWLPVLTSTVQSISANYSVVNSDYLIKAVGASAITVTLPQAVPQNVGEQHLIKNVLDAGLLVTVNAIGGSLIDGLANQYLAQYNSIRVISDGATWNII